MTPDNILKDLPRGEQGRAAHGNHQPHHYFEKPDAIAQHRFRDNSGDIFFGVIHGNTREFPRKDGRETERCTMGGVPVGVADDRHLTTVAGSRSGKGVSVILPNLLTYGGSVISIDPKGEAAGSTAIYRAKTLKQNVCVIDPFRAASVEATQFRKHFDPLFILKRGGEPRVEDAALLAGAIVVPGGSDDTHWDEAARAFIQGVLLHVVTDSAIPAAERTIVTAADLISGRRGTLAELLDQMEKNKGVNGAVIVAARTMKERAEKERSTVVSVARRNFTFLEQEPLRATLSAHEVDLDDLKGGGMTVYLVLPALRLHSCRQFLRLFVNLTLEAMEAKRRPKPTIPVLMLLDEFAVLGRMAELENAIGQIAGYGLRLWVILQDLGQLRSLYHDRWETFIGNSGVLTFFGVVDYFTSEWVSKYLDKSAITVRNSSANLSSAYSRGGYSESEQQIMTDLMTPAEVRAFFARGDEFNRQLVLIPGPKPWIMQRVLCYRHEMFNGRYQDPDA